MRSPGRGAIFAVLGCRFLVMPLSMVLLQHGSAFFLTQRHDDTKVYWSETFGIKKKLRGLVPLCDINWQLA